MSHPDEGPLDEGTLHAYLDGALPSDDVRRVEARLAASPEDQRRLERARAFLAEADDLLELVDLDPPIDAVTVVPISQAPSVRPRKRFDPLAFGWAAGFLVIIGGMWLMTPDARRIDEVVARKATGPASEVPTTASAPAAPTAERAPAAPRPAQVGTLADRGSARSDAAGVEPQPSVAAKAARDAADAENVDVARRRELAGRAALSASVIPADTDRVATVAVVPAAPAAKAALEERAAPAAAGARPAPAANVVLDLRQDAYEPLLASGISAAQAARVLGHPLRVLPGGNLRTIDQLSATPPVVRLTYWLQDGTGLTLYESTDAKALVPADAETAPTESRSARRIRGSSPELRWSDGTVHLRIRAPVMADSLERLRAAVRSNTP